MLLGFLLHGLGLSVWNIVPYNQLSLAVPASDYPKYYGIYECCFSMFSPAGARFLMMVCTVSVESRWGWRLPWLICSCATAANLVLVALFAKFERRAASASGKLAEHSYGEKASELLGSRVGMMLLFAVGLSGFGFSSLACWTPYIAVTRFKAGFETVQVTMAVASTFAYPISVGGCALLVLCTKVTFSPFFFFSLLRILMLHCSPPADVSGQD